MSIQEAKQNWQTFALSALLASGITAAGAYATLGQNFAEARTTFVTRALLDAELKKIHNTQLRLEDRVLRNSEETNRVNSSIDQRLSRIEGALGVPKR